VSTERSGAQKLFEIPA